jgi:hypothetical protein
MMENLSFVQLIKYIEKNKLKFNLQVEPNA